MPVDYEGETGAPVAKVVESIKDGIRSRRYAPGQRLIEADLSHEHGVRRGPVREALRILAGDGIVVLVPQKGARVRRLEEADIGELVPLLSALLKLAVRLSITRLGDPAHREALDRAMEQMRRAAALEDEDLFHKGAMAYADTLKAAAANRYLSFVESKLYADLFHRQASAAIPVTDWPAHLAHHEDMHDALTRRDLGRANALIDEQEAAMLARVMAR